MNSIPENCGKCPFMRNEWKFLLKPRTVCRHPIIGRNTMRVSPADKNPELCPLKRADHYVI